MPSLLTWNLNGLESDRLDERMEAACFSLLLGPSPPDLVLFQELVDRAVVAHVRPHFSRAGYAAALQPPTGEYFVGAFVRAPLKLVGADLHRLPSEQGRALLELAVLDKDRTWRIQTAHLESGPTAGSLRQAQLAYALDRLVEHPGPAVFAGDTNLREAEARATLTDRPIADAWESLGSPAGCQGTWTPPRGKGRPRWFRFDRVYGNAHARFTAIAAHQAQTDLDPVDVSDHRALRVELA